MGYPVLWDRLGDREDGKGKIINYDTGYVFAPRPLFPKYFIEAVNHPLNTQLKAEENFVLEFNLCWTSIKRMSGKKTKQKLIVF